MVNAVLALNAGSSSLKFALFRQEGGPGAALLARGEIEGIGGAPHFLVHDAQGAVLEEQRWGEGGGQGFDGLLTLLLDWIERHPGADRLIAVGHRVVHGGRDFLAPVRVTGDVLAALEVLTPLAPLHQPRSLAPVRAIATLRPDLPQIACFDTAFHHTMPAAATRLALPREYEDEGVRRYGFHGLSYEYIARRLCLTAPHLAAGRVIVAHLGSGASLCAMRDGRSIDTTMSFTALDGLVMGTRCGAIDPGVLLWLLQQKGLSPGALEDLLYRRSGLLGVSGLSGDMRTLLASGEPRAREAVELFVHHVARETGALAASLGGLDGFVFTAGIGEHAPEIRAAVSERLRWLGVEPAAAGACSDEGLLSAPGSRVEVRVIPTDEEAMIGQHTLDMLAESESTPGR